MKRFMQFSTVCLALVCMAILPPTARADAPAASAYTNTSDIAAFIDLFPIKSYNVDGYTYIAAEDLTRYGFRVNTDNAAELAISFDPLQDFMPMPVSEINVLKTDAVNKAPCPLDSGARKVKLNGIATQSYDMGGSTLIPFNSLDPYGEVKWDGEKRQASFVRNNEDAKTEGFTGRFVYDENVIKYGQTNGGPFSCEVTDNYSSRYVDGKLNGAVFP